LLNGRLRRRRAHPEWGRRVLDDRGPSPPAEPHRRAGPAAPGAPDREVVGREAWPAPAPSPNRSSPSDTTQGLGFSPDRVGLSSNATPGFTWRRTVVRFRACPPSVTHRPHPAALMVESNACTHSDRGESTAPLSLRTARPPACQVAFDRLAHSIASARTAAVGRNLFGEGRAPSASSSTSSSRTPSGPAVPIRTGSTTSRGPSWPNRSATHRRACCSLVPRRTGTREGPAAT